MPWRAVRDIVAFDFERPAGSTVLVIAPHPDDDAIGCGGTVARAAAHGCEVRVVYVTDGSASHVRSRRFPPQALARLRESEATSALRALGIAQPPAFLRAPDGALAALPGPAKLRLVQTVAQLLRDARPDVVFTPWTRDPHADHVATAAIVARVLRRVPVPLACMYSVWLETLGGPRDRPAEAEVTTVEVPLTAAEVAQKRNAILQHVSQTTRLVDDDPGGFSIGSDLLERWLRPVERFFCARPTPPARPSHPAECSA